MRTTLKPLWLFALAALALGPGCAPHEHLHVYGRVLDVTKRAKGTPVAGAEVWAVSLDGAPLKHLGTSGRRGDYEVELAPAHQGAGIGAGLVAVDEGP